MVDRIPYIEIPIPAGQTAMETVVLPLGDDVVADVVGKAIGADRYALAWHVTGVPEDKRGALKEGLAAAYPALHVVSDGDPWQAVALLPAQQTRNPALRLLQTFTDEFETPWMHGDRTGVAMRALPLSDMELFTLQAMIRRALTDNGIEAVPMIRHFLVERHNALKQLLVDHLDVLEA